MFDENNEKKLLGEFSLESRREQSETIEEKQNRKSFEKLKKELLNDTEKNIERGHIVGTNYGKNGISVLYSNDNGEFVKNTITHLLKGPENQIVEIEMKDHGWSTFSPVIEIEVCNEEYEKTTRLHKDGLLTHVYKQGTIETFDKKYFCSPEKIVQDIKEHIIKEYIKNLSV